MTETPEQRVQRLQHELAEAKVEALQTELGAAQAAVSGAPSQQFSRPDATPMSPVSTVKRFVMTQPQQPDPRWAQAAPAGARLAPAPRRIPVSFRLIVLPWSWWTLFAILMVTTAPIALWITLPPSGAIAGVVTAVAVLGFWMRRDASRLALLRWGEVATVVSADVGSVGTYYSGVTYQNVRLPQAHGWTVTRQWYSGPGTTTKITYELNGTRGELTLHGLPYDNGVVLAHSKHPDRAACVSSFAYDVQPGPDGNWAARVPRRALILSIAMFDLVILWAVAMVLVWR